MAKLGTLADQAERLGEFDLAEKLLRQIEAKASTPRGTMALAAFLDRRGHVKKAIDLCAPLWSTAREPNEVEMLTILSVRMVLRPNSTAGPAEIKRVSDGVRQALDRFPQLTTLMFSLGNLQERQGFYREAEVLYRRAIEQGDRNGLSHNNLAWLLALEGGGNLKDALEYVNAAIDLKGPLPDFLDTRGIIYLNKGENQRDRRPRKSRRGRSFTHQVFSPRGGLPQGQQGRGSQKELGSSQDQGMGTERSARPGEDGV